LAISALQQALADDETLLTVANTDWARFAPSFTAGRPSPLLSAIPEASEALSDQRAVGESDTAGPGFAERLAGLSDTERERLLSDLVRAEAAAVLGYTGSDVISVDKAFREQGIDSLTAVEMRDRLRTSTGLPLPSALVFDYPTPRAVAGYLLARLVVSEESVTGSAISELSRFETALWSTSVPGADHEEIKDRLEKILSRLPHATASTTGRSSEEDIKTLPVDQLLDIIGEELLDLS